MKVKYIITIIQDEELKDWNVETENEMLKKIRESVKDYPYYLEGADWDSVVVEKV